MATSYKAVLKVKYSVDTAGIVNRKKAVDTISSRTLNAPPDSDYKNGCAPTLKSGNAKPIHKNQYTSQDVATVVG